MERIIDIPQQSITKHRPMRLPKKEDNKFTYSLTINKTPAEVYAFCASEYNFETLVKSIKVGFTWDVHLERNATNRTIAWQNTENSDIKTSGHLWFDRAAQGLGTRVTLVMDYSLPGGKLTELLKRFKGDDMNTLIVTNLKRVKCYLETGEIATTHGQTSGRDEDKEYIH